MSRKFILNVKKWIGSILFPTAVPKDGFQGKKASGSPMLPAEFSERILRNCPMGLMVILSGDRIRFANSIAIRLLRLKTTPSDVGCYRLPDAEILDEKGQAMVPEELPWNQAIARGKAIQGRQLLIQWPDGEPLRLHTHASPWMDERGRADGATVVFEDITERQRRESELRESEEMYRTLFEHAGFGIALVDPETGKRIAFNKRLHERLGYTRQEYEGLSVKDIQYGKDYEVIEDRLHKTTSSPLFFEERHKTKHGELRHVLVSTVPIRIRGKEMVHAISLDITDRKNAEEALKATTEELDRYFNNSLDLLCIADLDGYFLRLNKEWEKTLGVPVKELEGTRFMDLVHPEDREFTLSALADLENNREIIDLVNRYRCSDGTYRWLQWRASPSEGLIYAVARDITEQRRLENQLRQAQKMEAVGRLAGGIAHDFNNMLSIILGYLEMIMLDISEENPLYSDLREIKRAAGRSVELTRQLLAFSRKQAAEPKPVDLNRTVKERLKMLGRLIGEDVDIVFEPGEEIWTIWIDPSQLDQVLTNLAANARDAIHGVGRISIRTGNVWLDETFNHQQAQLPPGEYVMMSFSDTGCGMRRETLERIFEPFFTTKETGRGTGLGMSTVYGIVRQNKGGVIVESEVGKGSRFKLLFPRYRGEERKGRLKKEVETAAGHETVLVAEDEGQVIALTKSILERLGYHVLTASVPSVACRIAETYEGPIHLLLTDVVMPEMNGKQLMEEIENLRPGIRTLFMSGHTADVISRQGIIEKGSMLIQKPFTIDQLAKKIRQVLDRTATD